MQFQKINNEYDKSVFLNCPFDQEYKAIFNAIIFTTYRCGFILRCSKEFDESNSIRIQNIIKLIGACKYAIHDLSRVSTQDELPRFNMPLELGIYIGAMEFGSTKHKSKKYLITSSKKFEYQKFISDLSGQDIQAHEDNYKDAIKVIRNWLSKLTKETVPSYGKIIEEYDKFLEELPELCKQPQWIVDQLTFDEYSELVTAWIVFSIN